MFLGSDETKGQDSGRHRGKAGVWNRQGKVGPLRIHHDASVAPLCSAVSLMGTFTNAVLTGCGDTPHPSDPGTQTEAIRCQVPGQSACTYPDPERTKTTDRQTGHKCMSCFRQIGGTRKLSMHLVLRNRQLKPIDTPKHMCVGGIFCCYCGSTGRLTLSRWA